MINLNIKVTLFLLLNLIAWSSTAQLRTAPELTLESPYNTIVAHLYYLQADTYQPDSSAKTLPPGLDSLEAIEIAIKIKQIFDGKGLYVRINTLPKENSYRDTLNKEHYYTPFPSEIPEIYVERIGGKWYYSPETVDLVPELHKKLYPLGSDFLVQLLPKKANAKLLGLHLWQHVGMLIITLLAIVTFWLLNWGLRWLLLLFKTNRANWQFLDKKQRRAIARFSSIALALWFAKMLTPAVQLPVRVNEFVNISIDIVMVLMIMMLGITLVNIFTHRIKPVTEVTESKMDEQLLPLVNRMIKIALIILAIFYILNLLNVNVTALIAGVSIGGLALALAAQDTVKNLIGSAMIFFDKPFQIDDYVIAGGHEGTIVEVGFRSTRIMQIDTSVIAMPNGTIDNKQINNRGVGESRMLNISIGVLYVTPPDLIETFIERLRALVQEHEMTKNDPSYVHLREFAASSINIMFRCYITVNSFPEELQIKEDLLFKIMRVAEEIGVEFAYPTTMVHLAKGSSSDEGK